MHTPSVFVINEPHAESAQLDNGNLALGGRYKVQDVIYRSAELELGRSRPDNIKGIKIIYLEPVEGPSDEPTDEEMRLLQEAEEWSDDEIDDVYGHRRYKGPPPPYEGINPWEGMDRPPGFPRRPS